MFSYNIVAIGDKREWNGCSEDDTIFFQEQLNISIKVKQIGLFKQCISSTHEGAATCMLSLSVWLCNTMQAAMIVVIH